MRKRLYALVLAGLLTLLMAIPALANPPVDLPECEDVPDPAGVLECDYEAPPPPPGGRP